MWCRELEDGDGQIPEGGHHLGPVAGAHMGGVFAIGARLTARRVAAAADSGVRPERLSGVLGDECGRTARPAVRGRGEIVEAAAHLASSGTELLAHAINRATGHTTESLRPSGEQRMKLPDFVRASLCSGIRLVRSRCPVSRKTPDDVAGVGHAASPWRP